MLSYLSARPAWLGNSVLKPSYLFLLGCFMLLCTSIAQAEGSRTLFPLGYFNGEVGNVNPGAVRSQMTYNAAGNYMSTVRQRNFFYVYADAGEYILLGTDGNRSDIRLYAPPGLGETLEDRFGTPGLEDHTAIVGGELVINNCGDASANITSRAIELAGPRNIDDNDNITGYVPCYYQVQPGEAGIYGVFFGTNSIDMWDVTVRNSTASIGDLHGRLFSFSFSGNTGGATNGTYATHYYVTSDGYRYSQTMLGLAPFQYALYSNSKGFLDVEGNPLYKTVRGEGHTLNSFRPVGTGIQAQSPEYPMFFSDLTDGNVDNAAGLQATLGALGIPLAPAEPQMIDAAFSYPYNGSNTTYVGQGGIFTISTQDALTYQIVIKGGNTLAHDDPAHPDNRVLSGNATGLDQQVHWDGLTNAGIPMPAGSGFEFEVSGRAGEVHFPFLDAEGNLNGGPTVARLNGTNPDSIVYYDDRGYTTNGVNVGTPGGHICGGTAGAGNEEPAPTHSLEGVDSSDSNWNGTGKYYRSWGSVDTGNSGSDCAAGGYFGDAKGMDLWAFIKSAPIPVTPDLNIVDIADVMAQASIPGTVVPGGTAVVVARFGNVGSLSAADTVYTIQLPAGLADVACSGATCSYDNGTGLVSISGLPTSLSPGQWTNNVTLEYTAPDAGNVPVEVTVTTTSAQPVAPAPQAPDSVTGTTVVDAGGSGADVLAQLEPPLVVAPGGAVNVPVTFRNLGPDQAENVVYALSLPSGLAGVNCSGATCNYDAGTGSITVTGPANTLAAGDVVSFTLNYTAPGNGVLLVGAEITTTTADNNPANNEASGTTTVSNSPTSDVTVSVAPPAVALGETSVNVPVTFRNLGPMAAADITYGLTLPTGLADVTCSAPVTCNYNVGDGVVTLTGGAPNTLESGELLSFVLSYTAPESGNVTVNATVGTSTAESNGDNNAVSAQTSITPNLHTVSFVSNGGSVVNDMDVSHGSHIDPLPSPTRTGYSFTGWFTDVGLATAWDNGVDTVTSPITLYAGWSINSYTISYDSQGGSSVPSTTQPFASSVSVAGPPTRDGYIFTGWNGKADGSGTAHEPGSSFAMPVGGRTLYAQWEEGLHELSYLVSGNGGISGSAQQTVTHGEDGSTVTAVPDDGYSFVGWSDGVQSATRTETGVTDDLTVTAMFGTMEAHTLKKGDTHEFPGTADGLTRLRIVRGGDESVSDDPAPGEYEGVLDCSAGNCRFTAERSGHYELTMIDEDGNVHSIHYTVHPNVGFSSPGQSAVNGQWVTVRVVLDDLPVEGQAGVGYTIDNGALFEQPDPVDLLDRSPRVLHFDPQAGTDLTCLPSGYCVMELGLVPNSDSGEIRFRLHDGDGALIGLYDTHVVTLGTVASTPIHASLDLDPGNTVLVGTPVNAVVSGLPPGNYRFEWIDSDNASGVQSETSSVVPPDTSLPGNYFLSVRIHDLDHPEREPLLLTTWLRVVNADETAAPCAADGDDGLDMAICDDRGTRIPVMYQDPACGLGEHDLSGVQPYLLQVGERGWHWDTEGLCLETNPGFGLRLGDSAFLSSPNYGAGIEDSSLQQFANQGQPVMNGVDYAYQHAGVYYDYQVTRLDVPGQSVAVVVPLPRDLAVPEGSAWRSYHAADGWVTFVEDEANTLHSARRINGKCPSPVASVWEENPGLAAGMECVRMLVADGGINDSDRESNGVISTITVLGAPEDWHHVSSRDTRSGGGGSTSLWMLLTLFGLAMAPLVGRGKRLAAAVLLALPGFASAGGQEAAQQEEAEPVRHSGWFVGGTAGMALGEVGSKDVMDEFAARGINVEARVKDKDRFAWQGMLGYRFGKYFSVDGGYTDLGEVTTTIKARPIDLELGADVFPASGSGWDLGVTGYLPVSARLDLYARVAAFRWEALYHLQETDQKRKPKDSGTDMIGGIGARYWLNENWQAGLGWQRYRVDKQDVDMVGFALVYHFGGQKKRHNSAEPVHESASVRAKTISESAPVVVPVAASALPSWVVNFALDSAVVDTAYAKDLDHVANYLEADSELGLLVIGHTDVSGTDAYNLQLSQRRAAAVSQELQERGVQPERIEVQGMGKKFPITGDPDEPGSSKDRRVVIEIRQE